jgi:alpha-1,3-mannosyl-glycoprotein beta-1,2-N-acetylglucosaminyltransferase
VSAWNDNGKKGLIDESRPDLLYRTDFFGGLGWMMTRDLWVNELMQKWPKSYWDDWMRQPAQRRNRACIRPEISRTKTFGKIGVSNGLFFDKHLKYIVLNDHPVSFLQKDLNYLHKDTYDKDMNKVIAKSELVPFQNLKAFAADHGNADIGSEKELSIKVIYKTKNEFKAAVKVLGIMDDFKSGVPRMAYKGIVSTFYKGIRVNLWPGLNWKIYNPTW